MPSEACACMKAAMRWPSKGIALGAAGVAALELADWTWPNAPTRPVGVEGARAYAKVVWAWRCCVARPLTGGHRAASCAAGQSERKAEEAAAHGGMWLRRGDVEAVRRVGERGRRDGVPIGLVYPTSAR
jgi:hypothetical protein